MMILLACNIPVKLSIAHGSALAAQYSGLRNNAVSDGAISLYYDHLILTRVCNVTYGIPVEARVGCYAIHHPSTNIRLLPRRKNPCSQYAANNQTCPGTVPSARYYIDICTETTLIWQRVYSMHSCKYTNFDVSIHINCLWVSLFNKSTVSLFDGNEHHKTTFGEPYACTTSAQKWTQNIPAED
jgi:hypothetical protein